jgi:hypothetical protein
MLRPFNFGIQFLDDCGMIVIRLSVKPHQVVAARSAVYSIANLRFDRRQHQRARV